MIVGINNLQLFKNYNQLEKDQLIKKAYQKAEQNELKKYLTNKNKSNLLSLVSLFMYMRTRTIMIPNKKNN